MTGEFDGRLILWHGQPGTGKTTAIRALARTWRSWASFDYVVDGDAFFDDPSFLTEITTRPNHRRPGERFGKGSIWRIVVLEDADCFLGADISVSKGLSLLLNVTDGILGQGALVLFLLSTNQPLGHVHPAVARHGRALANVQFHAFSRTEANRWLGSSPPGRHPTYPLSDLYAIRRGEHQGEGLSGDVGPGMYL